MGWWEEAGLPKAAAAAGGAVVVGAAAGERKSLENCFEVSNHWVSGMHITRSSRGATAGCHSRGSRGHRCGRSLG